MEDSVSRSGFVKHKKRLCIRNPVSKTMRNYCHDDCNKTAEQCEWYDNVNETGEMNLKIKHKTRAYTITCIYVKNTQISPTLNCQHAVWCTHIISL